MIVDDKLSNSAQIAEVDREVRAFFEEVAGSKLYSSSDGELFDRDSNWGFNPSDLAKRVVEMLAKLEGAGS